MDGDDSLEDRRDMHQLTPGTLIQGENRAYGHAAVLSEYAGFDRTKWIPGALQHGWNPFDGIGRMDGIWRPLRKFVWSEENERIGRALGGVRYEVLGAPWLYLLRLAPVPAAPSGPPSTVAFPYHPTIHDRVVGSHERYAKDLAGREPGPVTVCLQWMDHADTGIRENYARHGFRVVTLGRGTSGAPGYTGFLRRQRQELLRHTRAVSNRLSTALFYAASVGLEVGIYGSEMSLASEQAYATSGIPDRWPALHADAVAPEVSRPLWEHQLGADQVQSPERLRALMGWDGLRPGVKAHFIASRTADLMRLNARRTNGRRHLRVY
jgi:hypothetical protein